jgi:hypothetical protein
MLPTASEERTMTYLLPWEQFQGPSNRTVESLLHKAHLQLDKVCDDNSVILHALPLGHDDILSFCL